MFRRLWWPHEAILGRVDDIPGLHDISRHDDAQVLPGCAILRFDAPLIFANARTFRDRVRQLSANLPPGGWIIIAAEPMTDIDTSACDMLEDLYALLEKREVTLVFAEMKAPTREKLIQYGVAPALVEERSYRTLTSAVDAYRALTGVDWQPRQAPAD